MRTEMVAPSIRSPSYPVLNPASGERRQWLARRSILRDLGGYEDPMGPDILTIVANPSDPVYDWIWVAQIGTAIVEDDDGKVIDQRPFWEHEANARLMAAAPDMLEALLAIQAGCVLPPQEQDLLEQAISKAEGRAQPSDPLKLVLALGMGTTRPA